MALFQGVAHQRVVGLRDGRRAVFVVAGTLFQALQQFAGIGGREIRTADLAGALGAGLAGSVPEPNWIAIQL